MVSHNRILLIQEKGRHPENQGFRECCCFKRAFESLNQEVEIWGMGWNNFGSPPDYNKFDIIINMENYGDYWLPNLSMVTKPVKLLWTIDSHIRGIEPYLHIFHAGNYDYILQSTKDFVEKDPLNKSIWFPNAVDDTVFLPTLWENKKYFIGFCGSEGNRRPYLNKLKKWFKDDYKEDIWVLGNRMVESIQSYKIHFNLNISNDINFRSFETIGAGTVLCTNENSQYSDLGFVSEVNCLLYPLKKSLINKVLVWNKEFFELLMYYYNNQNELEKIANKGIELSKKHTYKERAKYLLDLIDTNFDLKIINN